MEKFSNWALFDQLTNVKLTPTIQKQLQTYYELLVTENQKYNLTTIIEMEEVFSKHFLDSLLFTNEFVFNDQTVADIGTGAGFPGVVLKIFYPQLKLTLIEANQKKVNFLNLLIKELQLENVTIAPLRAEEYAVLNPEQFDVVVSRAVAYLDIILEVGVQLVKVDGSFILLKGPKATIEIANSKNIVQQLGLHLEKQQVLEDVGFGSRINLFYVKETHTDKKYPRKYSVIKKSSGQNS